MRSLILLLLLAGSAAAQNILMKDGKTIATKGLRRQGDTIIATVELPPTEPGGALGQGEMGYPLTQIAKLEFPEPAVLKTAADLLGQGKSNEALAQLEPVVRYYEVFRDAPGSWWPQTALLKSQALAFMGKQQESDELADRLTRVTADPEIPRAAQVQLAFNQVRKGNFQRGLSVAEQALKESKVAWTRATAAVVKGQCLLETKQWEDALLAFLQVPVFYPNEKQLVAISLLGESRAHFGMDEIDAARAPLEELKKSYANTPEAKLADSELQKVAQREKALAPPQ